MPLLKFSYNFIKFAIVFLMSTVKIAKVTYSHFWTIFVISIFDPLKEVFRQSLHSKNSPEYHEATDMFSNRNN